MNKEQQLFNEIYAMLKHEYKVDLNVPEFAGGNFGDIFRKIEARVEELGLNTGTRELFKYNFPYREDCSLVMNAKDGELTCNFIIKGENYSIGLENKARDFFNNSDKIDAAIKRERLVFAPKFNKAFANEVFNASVGQKITFNNRMGVVCTERDDKHIKFKRLFSGDIKNIKADDFRKSETYEINKDNLADLQYLFGVSFDYRSSMSIFTPNINEEHGKFIVTDIETKLDNNLETTFLVGPMEFHVTKREKEINWYDKDGKYLSRDEVALIFAWASASVADFTFAKWYALDTIKDIYSFDDIKFFQEVRACSFTQKFEEIANLAFKNSRLSDKLISFNMSGLEEKSNHNYISVTYAFKYDDNGQKRIYKLTYMDNDFNKRVEKVQEVDIKEFVKFCENKYKDTCKGIVVENESFIEEYLKDHKGATKHDAMRIAIDYTLKDKAKSKEDNPLSIKPFDINAIANDIEALVDSYISSKERENGVSVKDMI